MIACHKSAVPTRAAIKTASLLAALALLTSCAGAQASAGNTSASAAPSSKAADVVFSAEPAPAEPVRQTVRVFAAGDNLIHSPIYRQAAARAADGGYNFDDAYRHVEPLISPADLAILNQETPIANDLYPPSNYPLFNSPTALGDKMLALGFNAICHANNHILDKSEKGLLATLDYWDSRNALVYGAYRSEEALKTIPTIELNGIVFSFVGFTEHTNGLSLPEDSSARIVYTSETDTMKHLIQKARGVSDVVVVSVHWGVELSNTVTEQQKSLAAFFTECGADIILGTHPHVVQTMEFLQAPDGHKSFVAYSLGNFISAQRSSNAMIGVTLDFNVTKTLPGNTVELENMTAIPVVTHYGAYFSDLTVYPYREYTGELAAAHGVRADEAFDMAYIDGIVRDNIPPEFLR